MVSMATTLRFQVFPNNAKCYFQSGHDFISLNSKLFLAEAEIQIGKTTRELISDLILNLKPRYFLIILSRDVSIPNGRENEGIIHPRQGCDEILANSCLLRK